VTDSQKPNSGEEETETPLFTDKRRVDPETGDVRPEAAQAASGEDVTDEDIELLAEAERDLVAEYRDRAARAEAELQNFRMRWNATVKQTAKRLSPKSFVAFFPSWMT